MVEICVLGSGSSGNCTFVGSSENGVLIDAGFTGRETMERLEKAGIEPARIAAILITHNHRDHIGGAGVMARKLGVPIYLSRENYYASKGYLGKAIKPIFTKPGQQFTVGNIAVTPFETPHDASDSCGFVLETEGKRIGHGTDIGESTDELINALSDLDALLLEFNHDEEMLRTGPYPQILKDRVASAKGHLSNAQAGAILKEVHHRDLQHLILLHLSQENNLPEKAVEETLFLQDSDTKVTVSNQFTPTPLLSL